MKLFAPLLLMLTVCATGCYTYTEAAGAVGKVVDADTGAPVRGASITRPPIAEGMQADHLVPSALPSASVLSDKSGAFNLPPAEQTQIMFMYLHNPERIAGSFVVTAAGYATNELHGAATSRNYWRVDLGRIPLKKP